MQDDSVDDKMAFQNKLANSKKAMAPMLDKIDEDENLPTDSMDEKDPNNIGNHYMNTSFGAKPTISQASSPKD